MSFDPISSILGIGQTLIDKLIPDPKMKAEAILKLRELEQSGDLAVIAGQVEINKLEAQSKLTFISGWRPFVGWVCATSLGFQLVLSPTLGWAGNLVGHPMQLPALDTSLLNTLLVGMLGLGGMRTVEKLQGVASK